MEVKGKFEVHDNGDTEWMYWYCPGCKSSHVAVAYKADPPNGNRQSHVKAWDFNGDYDKPTFHPSFKCTTPGRDDYCCHTFIRGGKVQYLNDCTHHLAGKTIDLPDIDE